MAAQRTPLGHKGRGEAAAAGFGPGGRTVRQRYAFGKRQAAAAKLEKSKALAYGDGRAGPYGGGRNFYRNNAPLGRFAP